MPAAPEAQIPGEPEVPVAQPSFMMPTTVGSPGAQMPIGQPSMETTPLFLAPTQPVGEGPASPFAFVGGFAAGLVAGAATVYSLLKSTGQKVSAETRRLELGMLNSQIVESTALAPYRADATSRSTALPALGRQFGAMNTGPGRKRVVVNMSAMEKLGGFLDNETKLAVSRLNKRAQQAFSAATAASITLHAEAVHAKTVLGINGALDFGALAGDQPGGEGTGKALGVNDDSLGFVLLGVPVVLGFLFNQWQGYQDDDDDFFDTYDSRRTDKDLTNRNR